MNKLCTYMELFLKRIWEWDALNLGIIANSSTKFEFTTSHCFTSLGMPLGSHGALSELHNEEVMYLFLHVRTHMLSRIVRLLRPCWNPPPKL